MAQYTEKDAAEDTNVSKESVEDAWHTARQDAALEQVRTGDDWSLPADYAISKVIQASQENDAAHGDSGK